jgi:hypothetical protein
MSLLLTRVVLAGLIVFTSSLAAAQSAPYQDTIEMLQERALADELSWELLESLTTDVGPRMAGTPGDALGVAWAQERMETLGFDRVWLERVEFPLWVRVAERGRVISPRVQDMAVTALGRSPGTDGPVAGEIVHFADLAALEAAEDGSLEGKIAFISARMERSRSGAGYGPVVQGRSQGPFVAAQKGATALIIRSVGTDNDRLPHTGNMSGSTPGEAVPSAAISNPDADLLVALLERDAPVVFELELDTGMEGIGESFNVIGQFDGRDDSDDFVLIGAHLDSWDLGTGAHDDGAGVAITMAAAKLVADLPQRPRRDIRVVLFANEEQGIYGGKEYARVHADEVPRHVLGAESDLGAGRIYEFSSRVSPAAEPAMVELAGYLAPLGIPRQEETPASGGADIGQISRLGVPVVDLKHDASRYFDLHHTANDVLSQVNPDDMAFNVAAYVTLVYFAAETDTDFGPIAPW